MSDIVKTPRMDAAAASVKKITDLDIFDEGCAIERELRALTEWRGIESAPKDGSEIIVLTEKSEIRIVSYIEYHGHFFAPSGTRKVNFTHWLPLPPPPKI